VLQTETLTTYAEEMERLAATCPRATFYHSRTWVESLAATYPHMTFRSLVARDGDALAGFLPYFLIRRGPIVTAWSMPFGSYGGPVATDDRCASELLRAYASILARPGMLNASWIDFSSDEPCDEWERRTTRTHLIDLTPGFAALWTDRVEKQRQKRARRAQRLGVSVRRAGRSGDLARYFEIYCRRNAEWGDAAHHPLTLFRELLARGGDSVRLYVAEHEGAIVGGHFNFYWKNSVIAWTGMTTPERTSLQAGTLLYLECLKSACEEGFATYNLGESLGKASLVQYKESLGGVARDYTVHRRSSWLGKLAGLVRGALPGG
jgi:CelD/BcsL family acetyltransferase involved in cellulose biosynthesis